MGAVDRPWTCRVGRDRTWPLEVARAQNSDPLPWEAFLREAVRAEFQVDFYHPTGGHPWKIVAPLCRATRHCPDTPARWLRPVSSRRSRRPHPVRGMPAGRFACWLRSIPFADRRERVLQMPEEECIHGIASSDEIRPTACSSNPAGPLAGAGGLGVAERTRTTERGGGRALGWSLPRGGSDGLRLRRQIANTLSLPAGV